MGAPAKSPEAVNRAYYPEPLPRSIDFSNALVRQLDEATGALHGLGGVGRLLPNPNLLIAPYVRLEAVLSSRIEGTQSNVADLLRYEVGDDEGLGELRDDVREAQLHHGAGPRNRTVACPRAADLQAVTRLGW